MNKNKQNRGITLVALVITVIMLLILAGVTISSITNSDMFEKAKLATEKYENESKKEENTLKEYQDKIDGYITGSRDSVELTQEIKDYIDNKINERFVAKNGTITKANTISELQVNKFHYNETSASISISIELLTDLEPGASVVVGTIDQTEARPVNTAARGLGYYGARGIIASIGASGEISIRNIGTEKLSVSATQNAKLYMYLDYNIL